MPFFEYDRNSPLKTKIFGSEFVSYDSKDPLAVKILGSEVFDHKKFGQTEVDAIGRLMNDTLLCFAFDNLANAAEFYQTTRGIEALDGYGVNPALRVFGFVFYTTTAIVSLNLFVAYSIGAYVAVNAAHYMTFGLISGRSSEFLLPYYLVNAYRYYKSDYKKQMDSSVKVELDEKAMKPLDVEIKVSGKTHVVDQMLEGAVARVAEFGDSDLTAALEGLIELLKDDEVLKNKVVQDVCPVVLTSKDANIKFGINVLLTSLVEHAKHQDAYQESLAKLFESSAYVLRKPVETIYAAVDLTQIKSDISKSYVDQILDAAFDKIYKQNQDVLDMVFALDIVNKHLTSLSREGVTDVSSLVQNYSSLDKLKIDALGALMDIVKGNPALKQKITEKFLSNASEEDVDVQFDANELIRFVLDEISADYMLSDYAHFILESLGDEYFKNQVHTRIPKDDLLSIDGFNSLLNGEGQVDLKLKEYEPNDLVERNNKIVAAMLGNAAGKIKRAINSDEFDEALDTVIQQVRDNAALKQEIAAKYLSTMSAYQGKIEFDSAEFLQFVLGEVKSDENAQDVDYISNTIAKHVQHRSNTVNLDGILNGVGESSNNIKADVFISAVFEKVKGFNFVNEDSQLTKGLDLLLNIAKHDKVLKKKALEKIENGNQHEVDAVEFFKAIVEQMKASGSYERLDDGLEMVSAERVITLICEDLKQDVAFHEKLQDINRDFDLDARLNAIMQDVKNSDISGEFILKDAKLDERFMRVFEEDDKLDKDVKDALIAVLRKKENGYKDLLSVSPKVSVDYIIANLSEERRQENFFKSLRDEILRENGLVDTVRKNFGEINSRINRVNEIVFSKHINTFVFDIALHMVQGFIAPDRVSSIFKVVTEELNEASMNVYKDVQSELSVEEDVADICEGVLDKISADPRLFKIVIDHSNARSKLALSSIVENAMTSKDISEIQNDVNFDGNIAGALYGSHIVVKQYSDMRSTICKVISENEQTYNDEIGEVSLEKKIELVCEKLKGNDALLQDFDAIDSTYNIKQVLNDIIRQAKSGEVLKLYGLKRDASLVDAFDGVFDKIFLFDKKDERIFKAVVDKIIISEAEKAKIAGDEAASLRKGADSKVELRKEFRNTIGQGVVNEMKAAYGFLNPEIAPKLHEGFLNAFVGLVQNIGKDDRAINMVLDIVRKKPKEDAIKKWVEVALVVLKGHKSQINAVLDSLLLSLNYGNKGLSGLMLIVQNLLANGTLVNIAQNMLTAYTRFQAIPDLLKDLKAKRAAYEKYDDTTSMWDVSTSQEQKDCMEAEKKFVDAYKEFNKCLTDSIDDIGDAINVLKAQGKADEMEAIQDAIATFAGFGANYNANAVAPATAIQQIDEYMDVVKDSNDIDDNTKALLETKLNGLIKLKGGYNKIEEFSEFIDVINTSNDISDPTKALLKTKLVALKGTGKWSEMIKHFIPMVQDSEYIPPFIKTDIENSLNLGIAKLDEFQEGMWARGVELVRSKAPSQILNVLDNGIVQKVGKDLFRQNKGKLGGKTEAKEWLFSTGGTGLFKLLTPLVLPAAHFGLNMKKSDPFKVLEELNLVATPFVTPVELLTVPFNAAAATAPFLIKQYIWQSCVGWTGLVGLGAVVPAITSVLDYKYRYTETELYQDLFGDRELHSLSQILRNSSQLYNGERRVNITRILDKVKDANKIFKMGIYPVLEFRDCELKARKKWEEKFSIFRSSIQKLVFENAKIEALDLRASTIESLIIKDSEFINCDFADFDHEQWNSLEISDKIEISNSKFDMYSFAGLIDKIYNTRVEATHINLSNISITNITIAEGAELRRILSIVPNIEEFIEQNPSLAEFVTSECIAEDINASIDKNIDKHEYLAQALADNIASYSKDEQMCFVNPKLQQILLKGLGVALSVSQEYPKKTFEQDLSDKVKLALDDVIKNKDQYLQKEYSISDYVSPTALLPLWNIWKSKAQSLTDVLSEAKKAYKQGGSKNRVNLADFVFIDSVLEGFKELEYNVLNFVGCEFSQRHDGGDLYLDGVHVKAMQFKDSIISNVALSFATIGYLKIIDSELSNIDLESSIINNLEIENSTLDKKTFFGLMAIMQQHGMSAVTVKGIKPSDDLVEYLQDPANGLLIREELAHLRNFEVFLKENPLLEKHLKSVYSKDALKAEIVKEINDFHANNTGILHAKKGLLLKIVKQYIDNFSTDEIREFYRVKDQIIGSKAGWIINASGLIKVLMSDIDLQSVRTETTKVMEDNIKRIKYSVEREKIADNLVEMLVSHKSEIGEMDLNALRKAITSAVDLVGDKYISLLNRSQDKIVGGKHRYITGLYLTGLVSIASESTYLPYESMLDKVKKIMAEEMGSKAVFDANRNIEQVTKS